MTNNKKKIEMNKEFNKLIAVIGIILLTIVLIENIIFTSILSDDISEHVDIVLTGFLNLVIVFCISIGIYTICLKISKLKISSKKEKIIIGIFLLIYLIMQIIWINYRDLKPVGDQLTTYETARVLYESNGTELINSDYMEKCSNQIPLAFIWSNIFHIFSSSNYQIIQYMNVVMNVASIIAILLIIKQISKKYKTNKWLGLVLIGTFISIPLLSTLVYGDYSSLAFSLFSIYFIMRYGESEKIRYVIISGILMAISYMFRMNNLIFIIAISIYMFLEIIKQKRTHKELITKFTLTILFLLIAILPSTLISKHIAEKFEFDLNNSIPTTCFLHMGMTDGSRQSGWYNESGGWAFTETAVEANKMYKNGIKERMTYFLHNPVELIKFYAKKTTSMWTENTYASIWYNTSFNISEPMKNEQKDMFLVNKKDSISLYQKALMLIIFSISIIVVIQNRKNLSNEFILLLTIFIGGFLFHVLWEAKSRYIIPYIVVLIPIATICINEFKILKDKQLLFLSNK